MKKCCFDSAIVAVCNNENSLYGGLFGDCWIIWFVFKGFRNSIKLIPPSNTRFDTKVYEIYKNDFHFYGQVYTFPKNIFLGRISCSDDQDLRGLVDNDTEQKFWIKKSLKKSFGRLNCIFLNVWCFLFDGMKNTLKKFTDNFFKSCILILSFTNYQKSYLNYSSRLFLHVLEIKYTLPSAKK